MADRSKSKTPASAAIYADLLAMQTVMHYLVSEIEKLSGSGFRARLKRDVVNTIEGFPDNAFAEGYEAEGRATALDLIERLMGPGGGSLKVQ